VNLRFAYNSNGTASHRLDDAVSLMAEHGYAGVALTLDHCHFDPFAPDMAARAERLAARLAALRLGSVIETGARYLLDPRAKHEPTLVTASPEGRARRVEFLSRAVDVAAILGSEAVSFWAGVPKPGVSRDAAQTWLRQGLEQVCRHAEGRGVTVALEPEPGMLVETVDDYAAVAAGLPSLRLALDVGHCLVTGERDPAAAVREFAGRIGTVSIEDMKRGEHVHLAFGEGDMDTPGILDALEQIRFDRLVCVELSRDSHRADVMIPQAIRYLRSCRAERREPALEA